LDGFWRYPALVVLGVNEPLLEILVAIGVCSRVEGDDVSAAIGRARLLGRAFPPVDVDEP